MIREKLLVLLFNLSLEKLVAFLLIQKLLLTPFCESHVLFLDRLKILFYDFLSLYEFLLDESLLLFYLTHFQVLLLLPNVRVRLFNDLLRSLAKVLHQSVR